MLNTPCSGSSMQTDGDVDWLHTNLSYQRQMRDVHGVFDMPVIEGAQGQESFLPRRNLVRSVQLKEAYSRRKRRHMREQYVWMTTEDKEGVLSRKRLNNLVQHLYIYDTDEALEHRVKRSLDLDIDLIRKILRILENNPYVEVFKSLGYVPDLEEFSYMLSSILGVTSKLNKMDSDFRVDLCIGLLLGSIDGLKIITAA